MGWGEPLRPPADLARQLAEVRLASRHLADTVGEFLESGTTGNHERLSESYAAYRAAVGLCTLARPRSGW